MTTARTYEDAKKAKELLERLERIEYEIVENPWFKVGVSDKRYYLRRKRVKDPLRDMRLKSITVGGPDPFPKATFVRTPARKSRARSKKSKRPQRRM